MRSSKSRSRSKTNRPRTLGNIINRVFDSSGPEGKVRGTPQQIIEKYQMLARDSQLSNDRVAAENFLQHAEHYTRLLAEAMREMAAEQESRGYQGGQNNGGQNNQNNHNNGQNNGQNNGYNQNRSQDPRHDYRNENGDGDQPYSAAPDHINDAPLVDLPEAQNQNTRRFEPRQPRNDQPRENQPREQRNDQPRRNERRDAPREPRPDVAPKPAPAPQLRFEDGPLAVVETGVPAAQAPIFESPAALVAQISEAAAAPKPRAPRPRVPKPAAAPAEQKDEA